MWVIQISCLANSGRLAGSRCLSFCGTVFCHAVRATVAALILFVATACQFIAPETPRYAIPGAEADRGVEAMLDYGCGACHRIPGVPGATSTVGPPLNEWGDRNYIAGKLVNTPENLILWLQEPQAVEPGTAMPDMDVTEQDARDIGAYLYTLRRTD